MGESGLSSILIVAFSGTTGYRIRQFLRPYLGLPVSPLRRTHVLPQATTSEAAVDLLHVRVLTSCYDERKRVSLKLLHHP